MAWTYPEESSGSCLLCVPVHMVPLVAYAFRDAQQRYKWASDSDWVDGYYAFSCLLGGLMNGCDIGESIKELNVLLAHALGLRDQAGITLDEIESFLPATGAALKIAEPADTLSRLQAISRIASKQDLLDLRGQFPGSWFAPGEAVSLYDLYKTGATESEIIVQTDDGPKNLWDWFKDDLLGPLSDFVDLWSDSTDIIGNAAEVVDTVISGADIVADTSGELLTGSIGGLTLMAQLVTNQLLINMSTQQIRMNLRLDETMKMLSGATTAPQDNVLQAIRGDVFASATRNVIDTNGGGATDLTTIETSLGDIITELQQIQSATDLAVVEGRLQTITQGISSFRQSFEATDFCCTDDDPIELPPEPIDVPPAVDAWCQRAQWFVDRVGVFLQFVEYAIDYPSLWTIPTIRSKWQEIFGTTLDNLGATLLQEKISDVSMLTSLPILAAYDQDTQVFVCAIYAVSSTTQAQTQWSAAVSNLYSGFTQQEQLLLVGLGDDPKTMSALWKGDIPIDPAALEAYSAEGCDACFADALPYWSGAVLVGSRNHPDGATVWMIDNGQCSALRNGLPSSAAAEVSNIHPNPLNTNEWVVRVVDGGAATWYHTATAGSTFAALAVSAADDILSFAWSKTDSGRWLAVGGTSYWSGTSATVNQDNQTISYTHSGTEWSPTDPLPSLAYTAHSGDRFVCALDDLPGGGTAGGLAWVEMAPSGAITLYSVDALYNSCEIGNCGPFQLHLSNGYKVLGQQHLGAEYLLIDYQLYSMTPTGITPPVGGPDNLPYSGFMLEDGQTISYAWGYPDTAIKITNPFTSPSSSTFNGSTALGFTAVIGDVYGVSDSILQNALGWQVLANADPPAVSADVVALVRHQDEVTGDKKWLLIEGCAAMNPSGLPREALSGSIALLPQVAVQ